MKTITILLALSALISCSSKGFNREVLRQQLIVEEPRQVTDEDIKKVLEMKPQLPKPFKVGVYFVENNFRNWDLRWNSNDKQEIMELEEKLKATGEVSKMFLINESVVNGKDMKAIRLAAAHHGADALLVISNVSSAEQFMNGWGATYILVLPALFIPGTTTNALFITRAALWDVRNEYLYMAVESESVKERKAPLIISSETSELMKAKRDSLNGLKTEILRMADEMSSKQ
ncbi:MAG: hypothetical protein ACJ76H_07645 [Bacteriovoracaceae bacterium]